MRQDEKDGIQDEQLRTHWEPSRHVPQQPLSEMVGSKVPCPLLQLILALKLNFRE